MKYFIKSNRNGGFLSQLFVDKHDEMFSEPKPDDRKCYYYTSLQTCDEIARKLDGTVFRVKGRADEIISELKEAGYTLRDIVESSTDTLKTLGTCSQETAEEIHSTVTKELNSVSTNKGECEK